MQIRIAQAEANVRPALALGPKPWGRRWRRWACLAITGLTLTSALAGATGQLNDSGQTQCFDGTQLTACSTANTGDSADYPGQDGRYGRDVAPLNKTGGGLAGFDFTRLCMDGTANCTGAADTADTNGHVPDAASWACTRDNVTGLVWSLYARNISGTYAGSTTDAFTDVDRAIEQNRCGFTNWRLPTLKELLSIVNLGEGGTLDPDYFPNQPSNAGYWTSDAPGGNTNQRYYVDFGSSGGTVYTTTLSGSSLYSRAVAQTAP